MLIMGIDAGTDKSGVVYYDHADKCVLECFHTDNAAVFDSPPSKVDLVAIEELEARGMPVGQATLDTCVWVGRFYEHARRSGLRVVLIKRRDVKMHLCGTVRAKDGNVRQALIDKFPTSGGGKTPQIGTKDKRGGLYGVSGHGWQALAVAVTAAEYMDGNK